MITVAIAAVAIAASHTAAAANTLALLYTVAGILAGIAIIGTGFVKYIWPAFKSLRNFFSDWEGTPARPGVPERPGMMKRMETVEFDIKTIKHEVHLNSGQSIKDIAQRTEEKVDRLHDRVDVIDNDRMSNG